MFKKSIIIGTVCLSLLAITPISVSAGSVTWHGSYGTATGSSSTYTWSQETSPTYRKVTATTQNSKAAPKIAVEVYGYYNGKKVISEQKTASNSAAVSVVNNSEKYANKTITGHGIHAVWSSTLARENHMSNF